MRTPHASLQRPSNVRHAVSSGPWRRGLAGAFAAACVAALLIAPAFAPAGAASPEYPFETPPLAADRAAPTPEHVGDGIHVARFAADRSWGLTGGTFEAVSTSVPAQGLQGLQWKVDGVAAGTGPTFAWQSTSPGLHFISLHATWNNGVTDAAMTPIWVEDAPVTRVHEDDLRIWDPTGFEWVPAVLEGDATGPGEMGKDALEAALSDAAEADTGEGPIVMVFGDFLDADALGTVALANGIAGQAPLPHPSAGFGGFLAQRGTTTLLGDRLPFTGHALAAMLSGMGYRVFFVGAIDQDTGALDRHAILNGLDFAAYGGLIDAAVWALPSDLHLPAGVHNGMRPALAFSHTPMLDYTSEAGQPGRWQESEALGRLGVESITQEVWEAGHMLGGRQSLAVHDLADLIQRDSGLLPPGVRAVADAFVRDLKFDVDLQSYVQRVGEAGVVLAVPADECHGEAFMTVLGVNSVPGALTVAASDGDQARDDSCLGPSRRAAVHGTGIDFIASPAPFEGDATDAAGAVRVDGVLATQRQAWMLDNSIGAAVQVAASFATLADSVQAQQRAWKAPELIGMMAGRVTQDAAEDEALSGASQVNPWQSGVGLLDPDAITPAGAPSAFLRGDQVLFAPYDPWEAEAAGFLQYVVTGRAEVLAALNARPEQWSVHAGTQWRLFADEAGVQTVETVAPESGTHLSVVIDTVHVERARDHFDREIVDVAVVTLGLRAVPTHHSGGTAESDDAAKSLQSDLNGVLAGDDPGSDAVPGAQAVHHLLPGMFTGRLAVTTPSNGQFHVPMSVSVGTQLDVQRFLPPDAPVPTSAVCLATPQVGDLQTLRTTMMETNDHNVCVHWADTDGEGIARFEAALPLTYDVIPFFSPRFVERAKDVDAMDGLVPGGASATFGPSGYPQLRDTIHLTAPRDGGMGPWLEAPDGWIDVQPSDGETPVRVAASLPFPIAYHHREVAYPVASAVHWRYRDNMEADHFLDLPDALAPEALAGIARLPNPLYDPSAAALVGGLGESSPDRLPLAFRVEQDDLKAGSGDASLAARPAHRALPLPWSPAPEACALAPATGTAAATLDLLLAGDGPADLDAVRSAYAPGAGVPDRLVLQMEPMLAGVLGLQATVPACTKAYPFNVPQPNEESLVTLEFETKLQAALLVVCVEVSEAECRILVPIDGGEGVFVLAAPPVAPKTGDQVLVARDAEGHTAEAGPAVPGVAGAGVAELGLVGFSDTGHVILQSRQRGHDRDHGLVTYTTIPFGLLPSGVLDPMLAHLEATAMPAPVDLPLQPASGPDPAQVAAGTLVEEAMQDLLAPLPYAEILRPAIILDAWGWQDAFTHQQLSETSDLPAVDADDAGRPGALVDWQAGDALWTTLHPNVDRDRFARTAALIGVDGLDTAALRDSDYPWRQAESFEANIQTWDDEGVQDAAPGRVAIADPGGAGRHDVHTQDCARDLYGAQRCFDVLEEGSAWFLHTDEQGPGVYDPDQFSPRIHLTDTGVVTGPYGRVSSGWESAWATTLASDPLGGTRKYEDAVEDPAIDAAALSWFVPASVHADRSTTSDVHHDTQFFLGSHTVSCEQRAQDSSTPWDLERFPRWASTCPWMATGSAAWERAWGVVDTSDAHLWWGPTAGGWTEVADVGGQRVWQHHGQVCDRPAWMTFDPAAEASVRAQAIVDHYALRGIVVTDVQAVQDALPAGAPCGLDGWRYTLTAQPGFDGADTPLWSLRARNVQPLFAAGSYAVDADTWNACKTGRPTDGQACIGAHPIDEAWRSLTGTKVTTSYQDAGVTHTLRVDPKALVLAVFGLNDGRSLTLEVDGRARSLGIAHDDRSQRSATVPLDSDPLRIFGPSGLDSEAAWFYRDDWTAGHAEPGLLEAIRDLVAQNAPAIRAHLDASPYWTAVTGKPVPHHAWGDAPYVFDAGDLGRFGQAGASGRDVGAKDTFQIGARLWARQNPDHLVFDGTTVTSTRTPTGTDGAACWVDTASGHGPYHSETRRLHTVAWDEDPAGRLHDVTREGPFGPVTGPAPPVLVGLWCSNDDDRLVPANAERETARMRLDETAGGGARHTLAPPVTPFVPGRGSATAVGGPGIPSHALRSILEDVLTEVAGAGDTVAKGQLSGAPAQGIRVEPTDGVLPDPSWSSSEAPIGASPVVPVALIEVDPSVRVAGLLVTHDYSFPAGVSGRFVARSADSADGPWYPVPGLAAPGFAAASNGTRVAYLDVTDSARPAGTVQVGVQALGADWSNATWHVDRIVGTPLFDSAQAAPAPYQGSLADAPFLSGLSAQDLLEAEGAILLDQDLHVNATDTLTLTDVDLVASSCGARTCGIFVEGHLILQNVTVAPAAGQAGLPFHVTGQLTADALRAQGLQAGIEARGGTLRLSDCWLVMPGHIGLLAVHADVRVDGCVVAQATVGVAALGSRVAVTGTIFDSMLRSAVVLHDSHGALSGNTLASARQSGIHVAGTTGASDVVVAGNRIIGAAVGVWLDATEDRIQVLDPTWPAVAQGARDRVQANDIEAATPVRTGAVARPDLPSGALSAALTAPAYAPGPAAILSHGSDAWGPGNVAMYGATASGTDAPGLVPAADVMLTRGGAPGYTLDVHTMPGVERVRVVGQYYTTGVAAPDATDVESLAAALRSMDPTDREGLLGTPGRVETHEVQAGTSSNGMGVASVSSAFMASSESRVVWRIDEIDEGDGWVGVDGDDAKATVVHNGRDWPLVTRLAFLVQDLAYDEVVDGQVLHRLEAARTLEAGALGDLPHALLPDGTLAVDGNASVLALASDLEPVARYELVTTTSDGQVAGTGLSATRSASLSDVPEGVTVTVQARAVGPTGEGGPWTGTRVLVDRRAPVVEVDAQCLGGPGANVTYRAFDPTGWDDDPAYRASGLASLDLRAVAPNGTEYVLEEPTDGEAVQSWRLPDAAYVDGAVYSLVATALDRAGHASSTRVDGVVVDRFAPALIGQNGFAGLLPDPDDGNHSFLGKVRLLENGTLLLEVLVDDRPDSMPGLQNCGIAAASLEYRPRAAGAWTPLLNVTLGPGNETFVLQGHLNASLLAEVEGRHLEVRAWAKDRAGHEATAHSGRIIVDLTDPIPLPPIPDDPTCMGPLSAPQLFWGAQDHDEPGYTPSGVAQARLIALDKERNMEVLTMISGEAPDDRRANFTFNETQRDRVATRYVVVDAIDHAGNGILLTPSYLANLTARDWQDLWRSGRTVVFDNTLPVIRDPAQGYPIGVWTDFPHTHEELPTNAPILPNLPLAILYEVSDTDDVCFIDGYRVQLVDEHGHVRNGSSTSGMTGDFTHAMRAQVTHGPEVHNPLFVRVEAWDQALNAVNKTVPVGDADLDPPTIGPNKGLDSVCYQSGHDKLNLFLSDEYAHYVDIVERTLPAGTVEKYRYNDVNGTRILVEHPLAGSSRNLRIDVEGYDWGRNLAPVSKPYENASIDALPPVVQWESPEGTGFFDALQGLRLQALSTDNVLQHCTGIINDRLVLEAGGTNTTLHSELGGLGASHRTWKNYTADQLEPLDGLELNFTLMVLDHAGWWTNNTLDTLIPDRLRPFIDPLPEPPEYTNRTGFALAFAAVDPTSGPDRLASGIAWETAAMRNPITGEVSEAAPGETMTPPSILSGQHLEVEVAAGDNVGHERSYPLGHVVTDFDTPGFDVNPKGTVCTGPQTGPVAFNYTGFDALSGMEEMRLVRISTDLHVKPLNRSTAEDGHKDPRHWEKNVTVDAWEWPEGLYYVTADGFDRVRNGHAWTQAGLDGLPEEELNSVLAGSTTVLVDRRHPFGRPLPGVGGFFDEVGDAVQGLGDAVGYRPVQAIGQLVSGGCEQLTLELILSATDPGVPPIVIDTLHGDQEIEFDVVVDLHHEDYQRFQGLEVYFTLVGHDGAGHEWVNESKRFHVDLDHPVVEDLPDLPKFVGLDGLTRTWTAHDGAGAWDSGLDVDRLELRPAPDQTAAAWAQRGSTLHVPTIHDGETMHAVAVAIDGAGNPTTADLGTIGVDLTPPVLGMPSIALEEPQVRIDYTLTETNPRHIRIERMSDSGTSTSTWNGTSPYRDPDPPMNETATYRLCPVDQAGNAGTCREATIFVSFKAPTIRLEAPTFAGRTRLGSAELGFAIAGKVADTSSPGATVWSRDTDPGAFTVEVQIDPPHPDAAIVQVSATGVGPEGLKDLGGGRYAFDVDLGQDETQQPRIDVVADNGLSGSWRHSFHFAASGLHPEVGDLQKFGSASVPYNHFGPDGVYQQLGRTTGGHLRTAMEVHTPRLQVTQWGLLEDRAPTMSLLALEDAEGTVARIEQTNGQPRLVVRSGDSDATQTLVRTLGTNTWYRFDLIVHGGSVEAYIDGGFLGSLDLAGPIRLESVRVGGGYARWTAPDATVLAGDLVGTVADQPVLEDTLPWTSTGTGSVTVASTLGGGNGPSILNVQPSSTSAFSAASPPVYVPEGVHVSFRLKAPSGSFQRVFSLENADGETMVYGEARSSHLYVSENATKLGKLAPLDNRWHRYDIHIVDGYALVERDQQAMLWVELLADGPVERLVVGGGSLRVEADRFRVDLADDDNDHTFTGPLESHAWARHGSGVSVASSADGFLSYGRLEVTGDVAPGAQTYAYTPATSLGNDYIVEAAFALTNLVNKPDHQAVAAGLDDSGRPLWAATLGASQSNCAVGDWTVHLHNANGRVAEVGPCIKNAGEWHALRVRVQGGTFEVQVDDDPLYKATAARTAGTVARIAAGDVFPSPDAGRSGNGAAWFDDYAVFNG